MALTGTIDAPASANMVAFDIAITQVHNAIAIAATHRCRDDAREAP